MNTQPTTEPFITLCRQLTLDLRAYLNMHASRPQLPLSLLSGSISTQLPRVARTAAARAAIQKAMGTTFHMPFPALANHPASTIHWQLLPPIGNTIEARYTITTQQ